jgi:hypothetical protein
MSIGFGDVPRDCDDSVVGIQHHCRRRAFGGSLEGFDGSNADLGLGGICQLPGFTPSAVGGNTRRPCPCEPPIGERNYAQSYYYTYIDVCLL